MTRNEIIRLRRQMRRRNRAVVAERRISMAHPVRPATPKPDQTADQREA